MMDITDLWLAGVGIWLVGDKVVDYVHDKRMDKLEIAKADRAPEPICGCEDHLSQHDPKTGVCHGQAMLRFKLKNGNSEDRLVGCNCRQYVGPLPIQQFWTPGIIDSSRNALSHELPRRGLESIPSQEPVAVPAPPPGEPPADFED